MKYATISGQVFLREDSRGVLDPNRAINLREGGAYQDDDPIVIDRPELFTDTPLADKE